MLSFFTIRIHAKWEPIKNAATMPIVIKACHIFAYDNTIAVFVLTSFRNINVAKNESGIANIIDIINCKIVTVDQIAEI